MRSRLASPFVLLAVLSVAFALSLGGAPPAANDEGTLDAGGGVVAAGLATGVTGPIAMDIQLFSVLAGSEQQMGLLPNLPGLPGIVEPASPAQQLQELRAATAAMVTKPAAPKKPVVKHVVQSGETLWDIAKKQGVSVETITAANSLGNANRLKVGQELKVPTVNGVLHTVRKGETLWDIAKHYKVEIDKIVETNHLASPEALKPQEQLLIPGAKVTLPATTSTTASRKVALVSRGRLQRAFEWPVRGRISSRFGSRWGRMHEGVDIAVNTGTPVRAAAAGRVTFSGWGGNYGYLVKVDNGNGVETRYAHNSKLLVKVGQTVSSGQVLARSGNTGRSTGPHVHFEIRLNGRAYNPLNYLR